MVETATAANDALTALKGRSETKVSPLEEFWTNINALTAASRQLLTKIETSPQSGLNQRRAAQLARQALASYEMTTSLTENPTNREEINALSRLGAATNIDPTNLYRETILLQPEVHSYEYSVKLLFSHIVSMTTEDRSNTTKNLALVLAGNCLDGSKVDVRKIQNELRELNFPNHHLSEAAEAIAAIIRHTPYNLTDHQEKLGVTGYPEVLAKAYKRLYDLATKLDPDTPPTKAEERSQHQPYANWEARAKERESIHYNSNPREHKIFSRKGEILTAKGSENKTAQVLIPTAILTRTVPLADFAGNDRAFNKGYVKLQQVFTCTTFQEVEATLEMLNAASIAEEEKTAQVPIYVPKTVVQNGKTTIEYEITYMEMPIGTYNSWRKALMEARKSYLRAGFSIQNQDITAGVRLATEQENAYAEQTMLNRYQELLSGPSHIKDSLDAWMSQSHSRDRFYIKELMQNTMELVNELTEELNLTRNPRNITLEAMKTLYEEGHEQHPLTMEKEITQMFDNRMAERSNYYVAMKVALTTLENVNALPPPRDRKEAKEQIRMIINVQTQIKQIMLFLALQEKGVSESRASQVALENFPEHSVIKAQVPYRARNSQARRVAGKRQAVSNQGSS